MSAEIEHIYIHIPFCERKCPYCDFYSEPTGAAPDPSAFSHYFKSLSEEWTRKRLPDGLSVAPVPTTIYVGGGSPSLPPANMLANLAEQLGASIIAGAGGECSLEINPDQFSFEKAALWAKAGFNRFSFGVQSFHDPCRQMLRRPGRAEDIISLLGEFRKYATDEGISFSLDLIYAIPGQSVDLWNRDLDMALSLAPDHISAYGLTYYEGLDLIRLRNEGAIKPATDDEEAEMFELAHQVLTDGGYEHYEISNYARPWGRCRHNEAVWRGESYLGLGASAKSRFGGVLWSNPSSIAEYEQWMARPMSSRSREEEEGSPEARMGLDLMLRLRTKEGIDLAEWPEEWGRLFHRRFDSFMSELSRSGLACIDDERLALTPAGWLVYDAIARRFFE